MSQKPHWERAYSSMRFNEVGWYTPHLETSLAWVEELHLPAEAPIIDVGGGASTFVDDMLARNYWDITVLDISGPGLRVAQNRLGEKAKGVTWIEADIVEATLPCERFALWHDRAVFHFLVTSEERSAYLSNLNRATEVGGTIILGTFATDAPPKCSGLPVERYSPEKVRETFGSRWALIRSQRVLHRTPSGVEQMYLYCELRHAA